MKLVAARKIHNRAECENSKSTFETQVERKLKIKMQMIGVNVI